MRTRVPKLTIIALGGRSLARSMGGGRSWEGGCVVESSGIRERIEVLCDDSEHIWDGPEEGMDAGGRGSSNALKPIKIHRLV